MIARTILRLVARKCLDGATLAEGRVFDSAIDPLDKRISSDPAPAIVIYTDDQTSSYANTSIPVAGSLDLVFEIAIAAAVTINDEGRPETSVEVAATDDGFEIVLDMIEHEIERELFGGGGWSDAFQTIVLNRTEKVSKRGAPEGGGARWAARQVVMRLQVLPDPPRGQAAPVSGGWADVLAAFDADADLSRYTELFRRHLFEGVIPTAEAVAAGIGIPTAEAQELGETAISGDDEASLLTEASAEFDDP